MFKIAIVIFREFLEIAILLGIVLAATKEVRGRTIPIVTGIMIGIVGASLLAFFTNSLASSYGGLGDEVFDAVIILLTVLVISWTVLWMQGYGAQVKQEVGQVVSRIKAGSSSKVVLTLIVASTIFREGSEIVLFVYSLSSSQQVSGDSYLIGLFLGAVTGSLFGIAIYWGLLKFAGKYVFRICFVLLVFIAAGLASEAAGILTSSGIITTLTETAWDSSWLISDSSTMGKLLKVLVGYDAKPNVMQLLFYSTVVALLFGLSSVQAYRRKTRLK